MKVCCYKMSGCTTKYLLHLIWYTVGHRLDFYIRDLDYSNRNRHNGEEIASCDLDLHLHFKSNRSQIQQSVTLSQVKKTFLGQSKTGRDMLNPYGGITDCFPPQGPPFFLLSSVFYFSIKLAYGGGWQITCAKRNFWDWWRNLGKKRKGRLSKAVNHMKK